MKAKYLFAYSIPIVSYVSITADGLLSWFAVFYVFVLLPAFELFLDGSKENDDENFLQSKFFDLLIYSMVPLQFFLMAVFLYQIKTYGNELSGFALIGRIFSMALTNAALGINVAHELGHRKKAHQKFMALGLLSTSLYMHFFIEHNKNHHKNVSTPLDHASAEKGINLYSFLWRSLPQSLASSFRVDKKQTILFLFIEFAIIFVIGWAYSLFTVACFVAAAAAGALLLESVNYIEHYGLRRKLNPSGRYEKVGPEHSWNSNHPLSRMVLFELSRHSDHHANADRPYQLLRHFDSAPQFPTGYPGMLVLAAFPFFWFKVMNPMLERT